VVGTSRSRTIEVSGHTYEEGFTLAPEESRLDLRFELGPEDWGKFTDLAIVVVDDDGVALVRSGFSYRRAAISFSPPGGAADDAFTLRLVGATADPKASKPSWKVAVEEIRHYAETVDIEVVPATGGDELILYPYHSTAVELDLASTPPKTPCGAAWLAELELEPVNQDRGRMVVEVKLD
jgi:hypothetical protein